MSAGGAEIDRRHPGDMERNIPHADGSRECHPVPQAGADAYVAAIEDLRAKAASPGTAPAFVLPPITLDDALPRLEEATRWMEEKRRDKVKADHELEVAVRQHARALFDVRRAI